MSPERSTFVYDEFTEFTPNTRMNSKNVTKILILIRLNFLNKFSKMKNKIRIIIVLFICVSGTFLFNLLNKNNFSVEYDENVILGFVPADDWFETQRAFPFDEIPNDERLKSIEYVRNNMLTGKDFDAVWTLAGPINIEGRITTVAIHPTNQQVVYAGCANGGIWKSTNFCQTWFSVFDNQNTSSIGSIAINPINPDEIYCGTGESNSLRSYYPGTGMYKSTNGGQIWNFIGLPNSFSIGNIAINPLNPSELYVAAMGYLRRRNPERGIYKSMNGGMNWTQSLYIADSVSAVDVVINPQNPNKVFAAMWERLRREDYIKYGGVKSGLYITTNSGANWNLITNGFPNNNSTLGRISLDINKSLPDIMYALISLTSGSTGGLYKSTNGGDLWFAVSTSHVPSSSYAWFNRCVRSNPSNPNTVYGGGLYTHRSTNGGVTMTQISNEHVDQHAIEFAPSNNNYVVFGNDGGIEYSTNGGSTWINSHTLPISQFYAGDINYTNPVDIAGGLQDNGCVRSSTGALGSFVDFSGGDGFYVVYDYQNPQRMYGSTQNGGLIRSTNGGTSFTSGTSGLDLTYTNWMTPYVLDKNNPLTIYCGTYKVFKSQNGMSSWTAISPDLANAHVANLGTITTVDVSKSNPNVIYCGTDDANVWVTTNGGMNWNKINAGLPYRWVTRVTIHPDSANVCYVTLSGYKVDSTGSHIFRTSNYGANWISIKGNLPDAPVNDVIIYPYDYNTLFIATDICVMYTTNMGGSWSMLGTGFPTNVPCHDLTFHPPTNKLIVWTHGRSAFSINITPTGLGQEKKGEMNFRLKQNYPNPFNQLTIINYELKIKSNVLLKIYNIEGKEVATLVNEQKQPGSYEVRWNAADFSSGIYFYKLTAGDFSETKRMILLK